MRRHAGRSARAIPTSAWSRRSRPPRRSPSSWTSSATTACGRRSTTSSTRATRCFPNLVQLSLWLATQTRRLKLGCAFNVLPMWHPIRLAEDYAMADIVTDGRVIMGVGRGYHTREVESFGAPLLDAGGQPGAVRGADGGAAEVLQRGVVEPPRQALRDPARRGVPRLPAARGHLRAAARSTGRSRSGCRSPAARPSTTWPARASRPW